MHPYMTEQLVRDRQAALDAEARGERTVRRVERGARVDHGRRRVTPTGWAFAFARRVRGLVARSA